jgi:polyhydroxyalkanoate synthase
MTSEYRFSNSELTAKLVKGVESLSRLREEDIQIGVTPKEEVYREDKVVLYRFTPKVSLR